MKKGLLGLALTGLGLAGLVSGNNAYAQEKDIERGTIDGINYTIEEPEEGLLVLKVKNEKGVEVKMEMYGTRENLEYTGENTLKEPDYVKSHSWNFPIKEEDFDIHIAKQPRELDNFVHSLSYTGPAYIGPKAEEHIVLTNGSRLDVINAKGEAFYIFNVQGKELITGKKQTDRKAETLEGDYKRLQELVRLTDEQLARLYRIKSKN